MNDVRLDLSSVDGRALDAALAVTLFGYTSLEQWWGGRLLGKDAEGYASSCPPSSSDPAAALAADAEALKRYDLVLNVCRDVRNRYDVFYSWGEDEQGPPCAREDFAAALAGALILALERMGALPPEALALLTPAKAEPA